MAKRAARSRESRLAEAMVNEMAPQLLLAYGFVTARLVRRRGMKLIEAKDEHGQATVFWLKQGWRDSPTHTAIQFGMLPDADHHPDRAFVEKVAARVEGAKALGATAACGGRPWVWGLAAGGGPGVRRVLSILESDVDRTLALVGRKRFDDVGRDALCHPAD